MSIATTKNIIIEKFEGIDNQNDPASSSNGSVQTASDVLVTDNQCLKRRDGYETRITSGNVHSVWSYGSLCVYCSGSNLYRLHEDLVTVTTIRNDLVGTGGMSYLPLNGYVYYSNGVDTGVLDNGEHRTWGLAVPGPVSLTSTMGSLAEGLYQVKATYVRNDGQESGTSDVTFLSVTSGTGISVALTASTDPTVSAINVYATSTNGEVFWFIGSTANVNGTLTITESGQFSNIQLMTQWLSEPPAGYMIRYYNGRIYIAAGNVVWYTETFSPELVNGADNYMMFPSPVSMMEPVNDGIWFATQEETFFLAGDDVPFKRLHKDNAGAIANTSLVVDGANLSVEGQYAGPAVLWPSVKYGFCAGLNSGQLLYLTKTKFTLPSTYRSGASMLLEDSDGKYFVVSLI